MVEKVSMKMVDLCAQNMEITEVEKWTMFLGFQNIIHQVVLYSVIAVIAVCRHIIGQTIVFVLFFSYLRLNAGGYHLKTSFGCICATTTLIIGGTEIALKMSGEVSVINILFGISVLLIGKLAPRRTANYPVDANEYLYLKKKSIVIVVIFWIMAVLFSNPGGNIIAMSVLFETLTLLPKPHV